MRLRLTVVVALLLASTGGIASAEERPLGLTLQVVGAVSRYDAGGLQSGVDTQGSSLLQDRMNLIGGSALLRLGSLDLGLLYERGQLRSQADSAIVTPMIGLAWSLGETVRLDLLAELGGHKISNIQSTSGGQAFSQARAAWIPTIGARPTLALRLPAGPVWLVGTIAPFARWDLLRTTVTLQGGNASTTAPSYELGGAAFGLAVGLGLEL
jgi:hypothetical protein